MPSPRVLVLSGYFDRFSGYQEVVLASWLSQRAETEVIASDRVSPMFSDTHLGRLGQSRRYPIGSRLENGVWVTRFTSREKRSMVWSNEIPAYIASQSYDVILQMMPGQVLPLAATVTRNRAVRAVLYGDNSAMWAHLSKPQRLLKGAAFSLSKGAMYAWANARADFVYGFTPNTLSRLRAFRGGKTMSLLPLAFDPQCFFFDNDLRRTTREKFAFADSDVVLVAAGKFQRKKRLDLLVDAFRSLLPGHPELKLLVVGLDDSGEAAQFRADIDADPRLEGRVAFTSFLRSDELNAVFNAADIGVWPRMPAITIQQAMGTGLLVVLPGNDWTSHLIRAGSGAYFTEAADDHFLRMRAAIDTLLSSGKSESDRIERAALNAWLGADQVATALLRDAGFAN